MSWLLFQLDKNKSKRFDVGNLKTICIDLEKSSDVLDKKNLRTQNLAN